MYAIRSYYVVLSGQEEATYAALGVISGFFKPKGLVGDIGSYNFV